VTIQLHFQNVPSSKPSISYFESKVCRSFQKELLSVLSHLCCVFTILCHYFIFNSQFDFNMNISKRRVNFQETLKSELVVKTLCSFLVHTCQMSKSFVALQKSLSCPVFKFIPNGHFNDRSQNFQTNRGGGCFYHESK